MKVIGENEVKFQLKESTGPMGPAGADGKDGTSVTHSWNGTTLTVTSASGTSSADLKGEKGEPGKDGKDGATGLVGPAGADGKDGAPGADGEDGGYYSPSVDAEGNLTWMPSKTGMPGVAGANIRGPEGPKGEAGQDGATGPEGQQGATGPSGADGEDGGYYTPAVDNDGNLTWTASKADMPDIPGVNIKGPAGSIDNMPIASATQLGGVMPAAKTDEMTQPVGVDDAGGLWTKESTGKSNKLTITALATGTIAAGTARYTFTDTGISYEEVLKHRLIMISAQSTETVSLGYTFDLNANTSWGLNDMGATGSSGKYIVLEICGDSLRPAESWGAVYSTYGGGNPYKNAYNIHVRQSYFGYTAYYYQSNKTAPLYLVNKTELGADWTWKVNAIDY